MTPAPTQSARWLDEGRAALLAGDKARAYTLLQRTVEYDPHSEDAWLWFSAVQTTPHEMAECLQRVLVINPGNEQAIEGLHWLATTHGEITAPAASDPPASTITPNNDAQVPAVTPQQRARPGGHTTVRLIEAALHPFAAGALLGLARLVGWLRPDTLVALRASAGPLGYGSAASVALLAALLHGGALLATWLVASWRFAQLRADGRGDMFDSLLRVGAAFSAGYVWLGALIVLGVGVRLGADTWLAVAALCWTILLGGAIVIVRGLRRQLQSTSPLDAFTLSMLARFLILPLIVMIGLLAGAGLLTAAAVG